MPHPVVQGLPLFPSLLLRVYICTLLRILDPTEELRTCAAPAVSFPATGTISTAYQDCLYTTNDLAAGLAL